MHDGEDDMAELPRHSRHGHSMGASPRGASCRRRLSFVDFGGAYPAPRTATS
ncbi:MAG: hypothetical protein GX481_03410 [Atopobium sp.]|nr:hypothetical protein [Atopobium sp.]